MMRIPKLLILLLVSGGLLASMGPAADAWASSSHGKALHTELIGSVPGEDERVQSPVTEIELLFSTAVQAPLSRIEVVGADGWTVATSRVHHPDPEASDRIRVEFQSALPPGAYQVAWRTVAPDGHPVEGSFGFEVAEREPEARSPTPEDPGDEPGREVPETAEVEEWEGEIGADEAAPGPPAVRGDPLVPGAEIVPPGTLQRWLHLLATVLLLGVVALRFGALRALPDSELGGGIRGRALKGAAGISWIAVVLLVVTLVTRLHHQLGRLGGGGGPAWEFAPYLIFRTAWGAGWGFHLAAIVLGLTGLLLIRRPGAEVRGWGILTGAAILLPLIPALQGHAMGSELRQVSVPVLYLHVAAVGMWLGGLVTLVLVGLPSVRKQKGEESGVPALARMVNGFSRIALVSVIVLVVSGSATSFILQGGGSLGEMLQSAWGRTLLLKLALVAGALLLGFYNWRRVRPSLTHRPDPSQLRIPATVEAFLGIVILLVTAALVALPLP
jgi:copper transport protein